LQKPAETRAQAQDAAWTGDITARTTWRRGRCERVRSGRSAGLRHRLDDLSAWSTDAFQHRVERLRVGPVLGRERAVPQDIVGKVDELRRKENLGN